MIPGSFAYHSPESVEDAVKLLNELGEDTLALAGGHSLIPMMKLRLAQPENLIDLRRIDALRGIREQGGELVIGAMTTQQDVIESDLLAARCPILAETAESIADPQVRSLGTLGGNVANGDPGNDMPAVMQCLDAVFVLQGTGGERRVAARGYYEAAYFTVREPDELLTRIHIPAPPAGHGHGYEKLKRKVGDYAIAAAAAIVSLDGGRCTLASLALTNVADTPLFVEDAADVLVGGTLDDTAVEKVAAICRDIAEPAADGRGPVDYRKRMAGVMAKRALRRARDRAQG